MTRSPLPPTARPCFSDGAESADAGWTLDGFAVVGATYTRLFDNYYIAGNRSYVSYDKYLKTGPYFFGYANTRPDWVDHYAYQEGLLISYWNTRWPTTTPSPTRVRVGTCTSTRTRGRSTT